MAKWNSIQTAILLVFCQCLLVLSGPRFKRVINGWDARRGEIPYQVRILYPSGESCGGVIIDYFYFLTASHCVNNRTEREAVVEAAVVDASKKLGKVTRRVHGFIRYKSNQKKHYAGDIALVKVDIAFPKDYYSDAVKPVPLQLDPEHIGKDCYVSGWGATQEGGRGAPHLQVAKVDMYSWKECIHKYKYHKNMSTDLFCAADVGEGRDSCQGDSGGPLVCDGLLTGLVRRGIGCGNKHYPGKYTKVALYASWIAGVLNKKASDIGRT